MKQRTDKSSARQGNTDADVEMHFLNEHPIVFCCVRVIKAAAIPVTTLAATFSHVGSSAVDLLSRLTGL
jgi:hypothetical protein